MLTKSKGWYNLFVKIFVYKVSGYGVYLEFMMEGEQVVFCAKLAKHFWTTLSGIINRYYFGCHDDRV